MDKLQYLFTAIILGGLISCERPFSFSVYEANVPAGYRGLTSKNLDRIYNTPSPATDCFKVAVLADVHYHYDELKAAVDHINRDTTISFTVVVGDLTELGLLREFMLFHDIVKHLSNPYLTVIGNHDYLSNGGLIYKQMYGDNNYSFVFRSVKFLLFDDIFWESNKVPDFPWLASALEDFNKYDHVIPIGHIPPNDQQFPDEYRDLYRKLMVRHRIGLSLHGHAHRFWEGEIFGDGVSYVIVSTPQKRSYAELIISDTQVIVNQVDF